MPRRSPGRCQYSRNHVIWLKVEFGWKLLKGGWSLPCKQSLVEKCCKRKMLQAGCSLPCTAFWSRPLARWGLCQPKLFRCISISQHLPLSVSQSVIDSFRFGDCYRISDLCELVGVRTLKASPSINYSPVQYILIWECISGNIDWYCNHTNSSIISYFSLFIFPLISFISERSQGST